MTKSSKWTLLLRAPQEAIGAQKPFKSKKLLKKRKKIFKQTKFLSKTKKCLKNPILYVNTKVQM